MSIYFSSSVYLKPKLSMSKRLRAFFNSGKNPCLTYPLLLVSNSTMFNASYISSSGSKLHLKRGLESSIFCKAWGLFKFKFWWSRVFFCWFLIPFLLLVLLVCLIQLFLFLLLFLIPLLFLYFLLLLGCKIFKTMSHILLLSICLIFNLTHLVRRKSTKGRVAKKSCDNIRKFQTEWVAKMPWAKGIVFQDGLINLMKYIICSLTKRK